jgi:hypothetical protein
VTWDTGRQGSGRDVRDSYRLERVGRIIPRGARRSTAWSRRSLRRSNRHVPRGSIAPVSGHLDSVATRRSSVTDGGVSRCVSHNPSAPSGAGAEITGTRNNVPSRFAFPMRKRAAGAFRKGHGPSHHSPLDAVGAAGARLASPTFHVLIASCFSIGAGMRTALAGAVRHPSVIDSEWTRVRCAIRSVDGRAQSRDRRSPQRTWMTGRRWPAIRGPRDGWRSWDPLGDDVGRRSSRSRGSRDDGRRRRAPSASRDGAWGTRWLATWPVGDASRAPAAPTASRGEWCGGRGFCGRRLRRSSASGTRLGMGQLSRVPRYFWPNG